MLRFSRPVREAEEFIQQVWPHKYVVPARAGQVSWKDWESQPLGRPEARSQGRHDWVWGVRGSTMVEQYVWRVAVTPCCSKTLT